MLLFDEGRNVVCQLADVFRARSVAYLLTVDSEHLQRLFPRSSTDPSNSKNG